MDFKVIISPRAIQDLKAIVSYVSFNNPTAAQRLGCKLIDAALSLATLPDRGRFVPEFADNVTREIVYRQYRIVYRVDHTGKAVYVSRFWHGSRLLGNDES